MVELILLGIISFGVGGVWAYTDAARMIFRALKTQRPNASVVLNFRLFKVELTNKENPKWGDW